MYTYADVEKEYQKIIESNERLEKEVERVTKDYMYLFNRNKDLEEENIHLKKLCQEQQKKISSLDERLDKFQPIKRQITDDQVKEIINLREEGKTYAEIRKITKWSNVTINRALNGIYGIE